jgi:hypothetical protein
MNMRFIFLLSFLLFGCEETYRYPCQNPVNWDSQECKKPFCSANGTCPEDLHHYEKDKASNSIQPQISQTPAKGDCK